MRLPNTMMTDPMAKPFFFEGSREVGVLLIHGFTGTAASMRPLGESIREKGVTVRGINLPGHGESVAAMAKTNWADWMRACREAAFDMMERCERVYVSGVSMGGVLSLLLAEEMPLAGIMPISAPMVTYTQNLMGFGRLFSVFQPYTVWGSAGTVNKDAAFPVSAEPAELMAYNIGYPGMPTAKTNDLLHLMKEARRRLPEITCPMLVIQSDMDETVRPESADIIMGETLRCTEKEQVRLQRAPHMCNLHPEFREGAEQKLLDMIR